MTTKPTASRQRQQRLLDALRSCGDEMSGQQLHRLLENGSSAMGLATVYRNLRQLQQQGLVRCRHLPTGEALYAPIEQDRHHLTCVDCGRRETASSTLAINGLQWARQQTITDDLYVSELISATGCGTESEASSSAGSGDRSIDLSSD